MSAPFCCFVTGTDTHIGKTLVSCALLHALAQQGVRAAGMKPVAAGAVLRDGIWHNDDADAIASASGMTLPPELATPCLLRTASAPHIAAALENTRIDQMKIATAYRLIASQAKAVVVEGVGGFKVPLAEDFDSADMAVQFGLPIIMVVGLRLGCINHALLTAEAIAARSLVLAGWVANMVEPAMPYVADNISALAKRLPGPLLGVVPHLPVPSATIAASHLDFSRLPGWPGKQQ